jgi:hypothetical protein
MTDENKTHPITIRISDELFREIDDRAPDRRPACRARYVLDVLETYIFGHITTGLDKYRPTTEQGTEGKGNA